MPRKKRAAAAPATPVTLRLPQGGPIVVHSERLPQLAMRWRHRVRNRALWRADDSARRAIEGIAREDLGTLGIEDAALSLIGGAGLVEVSTPYVAEVEGWDARVLPWEALLTAATRSRREGRPLLVVRHLDRPARPAPRRGPERALVVTSAPGALGEIYSFDSERRLIRTELQMRSFRDVANPTLDELRGLTRRVSPDIVHVTAIDLHQGAELLELEDPGGDGLYLRGSNGHPAPVSAQDLAQALNAGASPPRVVTLNAYNTAARVAALAVAEGAESAIGFQDDVDDAFAERFYASFYRAWRLSGFDTLRAFELAWRESRELRDVRGSGIVLWSGRPLVAPGARLAAPQDTLAARVEKERATEVRVTPRTDLRELLEVQVAPLAALNYALLHNGGYLFDEFVVRCFKPGVLRDVRVEVVLNVGGQDFRYRAVRDVDRLLDVNRDVRIPLTWEYVRGMRESTHTSLFVEVAVGQRVVYSLTHDVLLLPADEWRDTQRDGLWLPSFVLPRDPAVAGIVDLAQRYLVALRDDPAAGFDGYQSLDPGADDPCANVDLQVQALWFAIVRELGLSYINPPPTYTESHQRLRSPGDVVDGRRGTCIDLALLLAACLEYVEIYPVVFLLKGHAFPGYWRSDEFHARFQALRSGGPTGKTPRSGQARAWMVGAAAYDEILGLVRDDRLVPLESVWLTAHKGFGEASEGGLENLNEREEFEAMLDIVAARQGGVTPLPIRGASK